MDTTTFLNKGKRQLEHFRMLAEELEVQLALGKAEARDAFKEERKNLSAYLNKQRAELTKSDREHEAHLHDLIMKFEKLEDSLNVEPPSGKRAYDSYKNEVTNNITQLELLITEYPEEVDDFMHGNLAQFKALLDAYRVQLALSDNKTPERAEARKRALSEKVVEIRATLQKETIDEDELDKFVNEVSASFDHLKKAFSDLLG